MTRSRPVLGAAKPLIGMIHVGALPGTPRARLPFESVLAAAVREARLYRRAGLDAVMIENMHDVPYLKGTVGPEIVAAMAVAGRDVKSAFGGPTGIQILAGANREAIGAALAAGLDFIRAEGFVFGHVADEGWMDSCAGELLRYRRQIGADRVRIWVDIKKKHASHAATADVDIAETARAAEFFGADAVIVTGPRTASPANPEEARMAREAVDIPVLIGSGIEAENIGDFLAVADGFIAGSYIKKGGRWNAPPDPRRIARLLNRIKKLK